MDTGRYELKALGGVVAKIISMLDEEVVVTEEV
jgi:hypothetical protein